MTHKTTIQIDCVMLREIGVIGNDAIAVEMCAAHIRDVARHLLDDVILTDANTITLTLPTSNLSALLDIEDVLTFL